MNRSSFDEDRLVPLSALQHMIYCDRQAALIHLEKIWLDNSFTVEGQDLHRVVDDLKSATRGEVLLHRGVRLRSDRLGLVGKADVVEFHQIDGEAESSGTRIEGLEGRWSVVPVEYKRGEPKRHRADEVQLCAQGICLEEMFKTAIEGGSLFYGKTRRREEIAFTPDLRSLTEMTARNLHDLLSSGRTPVRSWQKKCRRCSLLPACLPPRRQRPKSVDAYLRERFDVYADSFEA